MEPRRDQRESPRASRVDMAYLTRNNCLHLEPVEEGSACVDICTQLPHCKPATVSEEMVTLILVAHICPCLFAFLNAAQ